MDGARTWPWGGHGAWGHREHGHGHRHGAWGTPGAWGMDVVWAWTWHEHGTGTARARHGAWAQHRQATGMVLGCPHGLSVLGEHHHGTDTGTRGHGQVPRVARGPLGTARGGHQWVPGCSWVPRSSRVPPQHRVAPLTVALCRQGGVHPGALLLHHHGVLRPGPALRGAACRAQGHPLPPRRLVHGHRRRHELPAPPQDHPPRPQVAQVSGDGGLGEHPRVPGGRRWWWWWWGRGCAG